MSELTIPEAMPEILAYLAKPGNDNGGSLHIVLADGNTEDPCVHFCVEYARMRGDRDGEQVALTLLRMSPTQRSSISKRIDWTKTPPEERKR